MRDRMSCELSVSEVLSVAKFVTVRYLFKLLLGTSICY